MRAGRVFVSGAAALVAQGKSAVGLEMQGEIGAVNFRTAYK